MSAPEQRAALEAGAGEQDGLELTAPSGVTVAARDVRAIVLELRRPLSMPKIDGFLVVSALAGPTELLSVPINEAGAAEASGAFVGFEQKQASITTTAWLGPISRACDWLPHIGSCPGQHYGSTSTTVAAHGVVERETLLGARNGANAVVTIEPTRATRTNLPAAAVASTPTVRPAPPLTRAKISASSIPGPGSYSGDVAIDPAVEEPKAIAVTVHAQDALIWALLVLLFGGALGVALTKFYDAWRSGRVLRASLQEAVTPYLAEHGSRDRRRPDRDYLDPLLIEADGRLAPAEKQFPGYWGQSRPTKPVPALYWSSYGLKTADVRASIATQVTAMTARFARWKRIEAAYVTLTNALARLKDPRLPVHRDGESVLDLVQGEPLDDVETRTRESAMATFAVIVGLYADVARRWKAAVERHGRDWETKHRSLDPAKIYQAAPSLATRTPEHAAALRLDFLRARRLLADPESVPDDKPARSPRRNLLEGVLAFDELNIDAALLEADGEPGTSFLGALLPPLLRFESADQIRRSVRDWDWAVFVGLSLLTALGYTLTFYVGKDWGSTTDYLSAFAAGATVPTVISWALLPISRGTSESAK